MIQLDFDDMWMDGAFALHRRERSRLWFRQFVAPESEPPVRTVAAVDEYADLMQMLHEEPASPAVEPLNPAANANHQTSIATILAPIFNGPAFEELAAAGDRSTQTTRAGGHRLIDRLAQLDEPILPLPAPEPATSSAAGEPWRTMPPGAPSLMLSSSRLLDARHPGPILGPGTRYRVVEVMDGIVGLDVMLHDGAIQRGYGNAIDMGSFDSRFSVNGGSRGRGTSTLARAGLSRVTQGLASMTGQLRG